MVQSPFCCHDISDETLWPTAASKDSDRTAGLTYAEAVENYLTATMTKLKGIT